MEKNMYNYEKKISVLMGVYNCEETLEESIESVRNQSYTNWELIICDDGSTDKTFEIVLKLAEKDSRIIAIKNDKNCGLNVTLNRCLALATGEYIARMDGDDICFSNRFLKQIDFLENNREFDIVSSSMIFFDEEGEWGKNDVIEYPQPKDVVVGSPICHAPVMMRKECMDKVQGYTENVRMLRVEDVNLWIKLYAAGYRCYNIAEPLYKMRNDKNAFNRRKYKYRVNSVYVRVQGCRMLDLKFDCYVKAFKPMVAGLVPAKIRQMIRKKQYGRIN